jgi:hypothetical protein
MLKYIPKLAIWKGEKNYKLNDLISKNKKMNNIIKKKISICHCKNLGVFSMLCWKKSIYILILINVKRENELNVDKYELKWLIL